MGLVLFLCYLLGGKNDVVNIGNENVKKNKKISTFDKTAK